MNTAALMTPRPTVLFWIGILLALDALVGLIGLHRWERWLPRWNIGRLAMIEGAVAIGLLVLHIVLSR